MMSEELANRSWLRHDWLVEWHTYNEWFLGRTGD